jgi:hypothetical protein
MEAWSPTSFFNRRAYGSENLSPVPQKDFCNTISQKQTLLFFLSARKQAMKILVTSRTPAFLSPSRISSYSRRKSEEDKRSSHDGGETRQPRSQQSSALASPHL